MLWAACGKDPGYNPQSLLASARRLHYSQAEVNALDFEEGHGAADAAALGRRWHAAVDAAAVIVETLPADRTGDCVVARDGALYRGTAAELKLALESGGVTYHEGRIGGAWPRIV